MSWNYCRQCETISIIVCFWVYLHHGIQTRGTYKQSWISGNLVMGEWKLWLAKCLYRGSRWESTSSSREELSWGQVRGEYSRRTAQPELNQWKLLTKQKFIRSRRKDIWMISINLFMFPIPIKVLRCTFQTARLKPSVTDIHFPLSKPIKHCLIPCFLDQVFFIES